MMTKSAIRKTLSIAALAALLAGCSTGQGAPAANTAVLEQPTTAAAVVETPVKPNPATSGYQLTVLEVSDPAQPLDGFKIDAESRLVAVKLALNVSKAPEKMAVDIAYATLKDDGDIEYVATAQAVKDELALGEIGDGENATGWIAFMVPKDAILTAAIYRVGLSDVVELSADLLKR